MKSDRELLELAAKAAGIDCVMTQPFIGLKIRDGNLWNPLTNDGDALRLAVKLNLDIRVDTCDDGVSVKVFGNYDDAPPAVEETFEDHDGSLPATRRAIVRAAAAIAEEGRA